MQKKVLVGMSLLLLMMGGILQAQDATQDAPDDWWQETVWYEIFVRSFYDSDGDGIGDFQGLIEKLDYLNDGDPNTTDDLGITGIWLMPIFDAASYHGYDAVDYYNVHPDFGTNEDFLEFMAEAEARGIRVIIDMVLNHTSDQHPWFVSSLTGDPEFADWYVWEDENPGYAGPWGAQAWHERGRRYFYGVFWGGMPDLNYENDAVNEEMYNVARFWIEEMGVDGFRLDAIKYIVEQDNLLQNTPANRQWLADYNAYIKSLNPEVITVGEADDTTAEVVKYVVDDAIDLGFEFDLADDIIASVLARNTRDISRRLTRGLRNYPYGQWASFLTNHDQPRLITQLNGRIEQNKIAATILLTIPGSPFLYYGEELGMPGGKPDPRLRTPMHWTDDPTTAGFTTANRPYETLTDNVAEANVAVQTDDPDSLLSHYRDMIALRNNYSALRTGSLMMAESQPYRALTYIRQDDEHTLMILINLHDEPLEDYTLTLEEGTLADITSASFVYGGEGYSDEDLALPVLNDAGGFDAYTPLPMLEAFSVHVIELR
jgi:alpha-amylase